MKSTDVDLFSFFSGLGFLDLGFETSGFNVSMVNERHKPFIEAYKFARKYVLSHDSLSDYFNDDISFFLSANSEYLKSQIKECASKGHLVGFLGGPPCPDFSVGGKNRGHEGENGILSKIYSEMILTYEPDFFVFENVKGLFKTIKHRKFYDKTKMELQTKYFTTEKLLNAIEFGAPQDRERILLIGFKKGILPNVTQGQMDKIFPWDKHKVFPGRSAFQYLWPGAELFVEDLPKCLPTSVPRELTVQHWFDENNVEDHPNQFHHFKPRSGLARFLSIPEGDVSRKSYKRLHRWRYSPTACYGNNEVHLHPYKARRISVAEALAIQSLPQNFILPESMTLSNMFKGVGNGVPYLMAQGIARSVLSFINEKVTP